MPSLPQVALGFSLRSIKNGNRLKQQAAEVLLKRYEIALARSVKQSKDRFIAECAAAYRSHRERDFHTQLLTHRLEVKALLAQQARVVIPHFARLTTQQITAGIKRRGRIETKRDGSSLFDQLIASWLGQRQQMASTIAQTTLNDMLNAVQGGIDEGDGTDAIARSITQVTGFSPYRSLTVARTETHGAALFAQAEAAREAEKTYDLVLVKEWLPTLDDRTRDSHAEMSSYGPIPLDEKFIVGGMEMDRPGDPAGGPAECCQCRCTLIHRQAGDE